MSRRASAAPLRTLRREALRRSLSGRFWLRFHASLIVGATFAAGFLASFLLLRAGLDAVLPRWLLAIAVGYAACFLLVRFWLAYVGVRNLARAGDGNVASSPAEGVDLGLPGVRWQGGGGRFGGAGASGDFAAPRLSPLTGTSSSHAPAAGDVAGSLVDGVDDALPIVLGLVVLALVAALLGSAAMFVWMAPELLTDAAFAALLASGALPGLAKADSPDWHGTLFAATWKPLVLVVAVTVGAALALGHWFPQARTLGEAWSRVAER